MAEQSGIPATGVRLRAYYSDDDLDTLEGRVNVVAARLEAALGMDGSSIQRHKGRWHGEVEYGYIIEIVTDGYGHPREVLEAVKPELHKAVHLFNLTAYVTAEQVECMEVF